MNMINTSMYMERIERLYFKRCKENVPFTINDILCIKTDLGYWHFEYEKSYLVYLEDGESELKKLRKTIITKLEFLEEERHNIKLLYLKFTHSKGVSILRFRSNRVDNKFKIYKEAL